MTEEPTTDYDDLLFGVRRSIRYHDRRVAFFDRFHRFVLFLTMIAGSAGIVAFIAEFSQAWPQWLKLLPIALISLAAGIDLVVGTADKARLHDRLKARFIALEKTMQLSGETDDVQREWKTERLDIESDEPPVLRILDTLCHNEVMRSMGYAKDRFIPVNTVQRLLSPFCDWDADAL